MLKNSANWNHLASPFVAILVGLLNTPGLNAVWDRSSRWLALETDFKNSTPARLPSRRRAEDGHQHLTSLSKLQTYGMICIEQDVLIFRGQLSDVVIVVDSLDSRGSIGYGFQVETKVLPTISVLEHMVFLELLQAPYNRLNPLRIKLLCLTISLGPFEKVQIWVFGRRNWDLLFFR
jgi:hypothetical protein